MNKQEQLKARIPSEFISFLKTRFGAEAQIWLDKAPEIVCRKLTDWGLRYNPMCHRMAQWG